MTELLANLAVVVATAVTFVFLLPQIVKLIRTRDSAGVSTTWPAIGVVSNVGWVVYLAQQTLWLSVAAPVGAVVGYGATLWALGSTGRPLRASFVRGAWFGLLLVGIAAGLGWTALGVALGLSFGVMMAPSLWTAFRTPDPSGISPGTWWLGIVEALLWGFYGWHHADAGILSFAVIALLGSAAMLGRYGWTRGRQG